MIVTMMLQPAIDRVVVLNELRLGDRSRVHDGATHPGRKRVNVSWMIRALGGETLAQGFSGRLLRQSLVVDRLWPLVVVEPLQIEACA